MNFFTLFILIAGFIIGLGAVTVIDFHGFLGRKSSYWTVATTRAHKITKPLIWLGTFLVLVGGVFHYAQIDQTLFGFPLLFAHLIMVSVMILNGIFLSFVISPYLLKREKEGRDGEILPATIQNKITISFIFSFIFWWSSVIMLVITLI